MNQIYQWIIIIVCIKQAHKETKNPTPPLLYLIMQKLSCGQYEFISIYIKRIFTGS